MLVFILFQAPTCIPDQLQCVKNVTSVFEDSQCLKECNGLLVTSYLKSDTKLNLDEVLGQTIEQYNNYSLYFQYPVEIKGFKIKNKIYLFITYFFQIMNGNLD